VSVLISCFLSAKFIDILYYWLLFVLESTGATRKEENPFSFRHFLKRDLSLPGNSTYENTGARPKVYANTVQHSPTKIDIHADSRREKNCPTDTQAKDKSNDAGSHRISDNTSSSSSVEVPFSVVDDSESKHNFYTDNSNVPYFQRPNLASEPLGMPSLPDFVQDHILVEQAYLNSNGPISVDLDNLPDFTFNTNFNTGPSPSIGRRNNGNYNSNRGYDYETYMGAASASNESGSGRGIPLDLPAGAEASGPVPVPLDLPAHLSLDLTESVNPSDRRNTSPRNTFPLDLPPNAGDYDYYKITLIILFALCVYLFIVWHGNKIQINNYKNNIGSAYTILNLYFNDNRTQDLF
jgi:hypothetical protein